MAEMSAPLDVRRPDGFYVVREVFRAAFFLRAPHLSINEQIIEGLDRILESFIGSQFGFIAGATGDWFPRTSAQLTTEIAGALADAKRTINGTVTIASDPAVSVSDYYCEYNGFALDRPLFAKRACFLFFWLPREVFLARPEDVERLCLSLCESLPISCAHADMALVGNQTRRQQLARRYVGLDISDVSSTAIDQGDNAGGAYWLTVFGSQLVDRLGGLKTIRRSLPAADRVAELAGGRVAVKLTKMPARGDLNRREELPAHAELARLLEQAEALHVPSRVTYFEDEDAGEDHELQRMWHRRFVDREWGGGGH